MKWARVANAISYGVLRSDQPTFDVYCHRQTVREYCGELIGDHVQSRFNLYHVATFVLLIFFAGHTLGGVVFHKNLGAQEESIWSAMKSVHFTFNGSDCTYFGFQVGYGWLTAILLLLSSFLTWQLGRRDSPIELRPIGWALFLSYLGVTWISFQYFFVGPGILSTIVTFILGYKCFSGLQVTKPGVR